MAINKKQQIRGVRILLTVFYGFLLSTILFRYIIHGIVETIRRPTNPYAITMIVLGGLILISIALATYATWFDNTVIMLVSGVVLICVFVLTLVFGIVRIINTAPHRTISATITPSDVAYSDSLADKLQPITSDKATTTTTTDTYILAEEVTKLIIELVSILFAILGTFVLFRYVKGKYASVPTTESKPT
ncbi:hypothetical protein I4U23_028433 [Adineta vaga]|nr:hypothetical protein I4U23_028433 [Adineta vaga]